MRLSVVYHYDTLERGREMSQNSEIEINPSVLEERSETYTSLTDVNGADVFTDRYGEKVAEYQKQKQARYGSAAEAVFKEVMRLEPDAEEAVRGQLFMEASGQVIQNSPPSSRVKDTMLLPFIGILMVISAVLLLHYLKNRRGKWEKDANNTYSYE